MKGNGKIEIPIIANEKEYRFVMPLDGSNADEALEVLEKLQSEFLEAKKQALAEEELKKEDISKDEPEVKDGLS